MKNSRKTKSFDCNQQCVQSTVDVFGDKWTPLLVLCLSSGPKKFSEFECALSGMSPRTLSQRLDALVHEAIITKDKYQENPIRYQYTLTQKGTDLQAILKSMESWGSKYNTKVR